MPFQEFELLNKQLTALVTLNAKEQAEVLAVWSVVTLHKGDHLLKEGDICRFVGFITQGAMIYYTTKVNGEEVTTDFAMEGSWVCNNQSRLNGTPSLVGIKAVEDSQVLVVKQDALNDLYLRHPKLERFGRILMEQAFLSFVEQSLDLQILSATERYQKLLERYPQIFQKFPLYHIANYLGIAPKSLSRIRKQLFE
jgi:cAMP-binding proteins - catabolite gene activator and regulatory subunit of cAMP-dependent protein kinases